MSTSDIVLVFVGIPAAVVLIIAVLVMAGGRSHRRYRPGRPFDFTPVWFLSSPEQVAQTPGRAALHAGERPALAAGEVEIKAAPVRPGTTGGASDSW